MKQDNKPGSKTDALIMKCQADLCPAIDAATEHHDFHVVLAILLERAGNIAQAAISCKVFTPKQCAAYFGAALETALTPRAGGVTLGHVDDGTPGRKH